MKASFFPLFAFVAFASVNGFCQELKENKRQLQEPVKQLKATENNVVEPMMVRQTEPSIPNQVNTTGFNVQSTSTTESFTPIPAEGYTDENYFINLQKSREQEARLNANITVPPAIEPIDIQIEKYRIERDKYPVGSYEYETIQEKINQLQGN